MKLQLTGLLEGLSDQIKESELNIIIHSVETALSNAKEEKKLLELESKLQLETFKDQKEVLNAKKNVISKLIQTYTDEVYFIYFFNFFAIIKSNDFSLISVNYYIQYIPALFETPLINNFFPV